MKKIYQVPDDSDDSDDISPETPFLSDNFNEINILKTLNHSSIIKCVDYFMNNNGKIHILYELMCGDLTLCIKKQSRMPKILIESYMYQLVMGLDYLHNNNIVHRDLKPQNLLIDTEGYIKIADFGMAKKLVKNEENSLNVTTLWYRAPEILLSITNYDTSSDMWSLGCIFAEMLIGHAIFRGSNQIDQLSKICDVLGHISRDEMLNYYKNNITPTNNNNSNLEKTLLHIGRRKNEYDLLSDMLKHTNRITSSSALKHPYFSETIKSLFMKINHQN